MVEKDKGEARRTEATAAPRTVGAIIALSCAVALAGCSKATFDRAFNYGNSGRVTCWSGGKVVFDDYSTGRIERSPAGADGYYYVSVRTGRLTEASGDCLIDYGARPSEQPLEAPTGANARAAARLSAEPPQ